MKQYKASEVKAFIEGKLNKINQTSRTLEDLYNFIMKEYENEIAYSYFDDEGKEIIPLLDTLCQNNQCIPSFILNNGIDCNIMS